MNQTSQVSGRGSTRATFVAAYSAVTLAQVTNALPGALNGTFAVEFQTSGAGLTWIAGMFMMGIVVFELSWGLLGDLFGRKKLLYAGAVLSIAGSVLAALAPSTGIMIAAQAVGGIGAGILFPISLSMIAAITPLPVLGVPIESKALRGLDSLLSIVQMPGGVPVGTLAIGAAGAKNAALLAAAILALGDAGLRQALDDWRAEQTAAVADRPA